MTFLKKFSYLFLASVLLFACEPTPPPQPDCTNCPTVNFSGHLELQMLSTHPVEYEPVLQLSVSYEGSGTSNMMPQFSLNTSHVEEVPDNQTEFKIQEGSFELQGDGDDRIFGFYSGQGYQIPGNSNVTWYFSIEGGSGKFLDASGTMSVSISDKNKSRWNPEQPLQAQITGVVRLPDDES